MTLVTTQRRTRQGNAMIRQQQAAPLYPIPVIMPASPRLVETLKAVGLPAV